MMNFVRSFYFFIIIILRSRGVVQSAADFTLKELKHVSGKLKPVECMRLIEAIYSAIPYSNGRERKSMTRETPVNAWISKHACLDELRTWSRHIPEKTEPELRRVMVLHLNAIGRSDLGNYLRKNDPRYNKRILKRLGMRKKIRRARTRGNHKTNEEIIHFHKRINAAITVRPESDGRKVRQVVMKRVKQSTGMWKNTLSENLLISLIALGLVVTSVCGILMFVIRKRVRTSTCCEKRSNSRQPGGMNGTQEKGLQCIGCLQDDYLKRVETESKASQVSEIDVERGSWDHNFAEIETHRSISDSAFSNGNETLRVSIEKLETVDDESKVQTMKKSRPSNSCRHRSPEAKTCCEPKKRKTKKRKKKVKGKVKEESKTTKGCLKAMREKILPSSKKRKFKIPNENCGVCQCCNCISFQRQEANRSCAVNERSKKLAETGKHVCVGNESRKYKRSRKCSKNEEDEGQELYKDSVASGSSKLKKRSKHTERKSLKCSLNRPGTSKAKRVRLLASSSETEARCVEDKPKRSS